MTREPDDAAADPAAPDVDDAELAALEASAAQARADARRAAQAVRMARRARVGRAAPVEGAEPAEPMASTADRPATSGAVSLDKPGDAVVDDEDDLGEADDDALDDLDDEDPDESDQDEDDDESDDESDADDADEHRRRPRRVTVYATVFAVLAAVFAVIAFVVHQNAQDDRATSPAAARDAALLAARQDVVVLNTLDYKDVDGGLQRWLGATTGTLHDQLSQVSDADKQAIAVSKSVTTASVLAAAVTQVDATKGTATVIASVQIVVTPESGTATTKRNRFSLAMAKVGDVWKIGAVQQVPVTLT